MQGRSNFDNTVTLTGLMPGDAGVFGQTLPAMAAAVRGELPPDFAGWRDERLRRNALLVVTGHRDSDAINTLFEHVRDAIPYYPDTELCSVRGLECASQQIVQDAPVTLGWRDGKPGGKCTDKVVLLAAMLRTLGYVSRFAVQKHKQPDGSIDWDHVYLEVYDNDAGEWIALDPTADGHGPRPLAPVGWRNPALEESNYEIFGGELMANGLGDIFGNPDPTNLDWTDLAARGIDVFGAYLSRSPYISPDDPRYQQYINAGYRPPFPDPNYRGTAAQPGAQFSASGTNIQMPWWGWALVGGLAISYFFGKGRR